MHRRLFTFIMIVSIYMSATPVFAQSQPVLLDLKSASQLALTSNPQLGSAGAMVEISKAGINKAKSAQHPTVGAESTYSYLSKETMFGPTSIWAHNTVINRIGAQQTIYSGGQIEANVNRAQLGYLASTYSVNAAKADVLAGVGIAYFRARQAKETIDIAQASIKSLEASHDAAKKMNESGIVTKSDVLRAQVALTTAQDSLIASKNNYNVAIAALRAAIGLSSETKIDLSEEANDTAPNAASEAIAAERPEISAGNAYIEASQQAKIAAEAGKKPVVAVSADFFNQPSGAQFPRLSNTLMIGVAVKFNAFDGGLTRASIEEADATVIRARQDLESQKRRVELEQTAAKLDLDSANARVQTTVSQVQLAEEIVRVLQAGYKEGITPLTDVLSAESALTAARVNRLAAIYDVKIAQVNLLRAFGQTDVLVR